MLTVVDLFAGAGGLSLGFQQTHKYCIKVAFESDTAMQATYKQNHSNVTILGNVYDANYDEIIQTFGTIDVVIGGPPCQGFSNANRQKNNTINYNNALVKEYIRAIKALNPKAFVMENVSMLRSDIHRFFMSENDIELIKNNSINIKNSKIQLLCQQYMFNDAISIVKNKEYIKYYLWPEQDFTELNIIYKATRSIKKLIAALLKYKNKLLRNANLYISANDDSQIKKADAKAYIAVQDYFNNRIQANQIKDNIESAIMYQQMLIHANEILDNNLVVNDYIIDNGLYAIIPSFSVLDYINSALGCENDGYTINSDILCAADYGAPQKRMRFIMVGIKKNITDYVELPERIVPEDQYRTVHDAISDLEDIEPFYDLSNDVGIILKNENEISCLAKELRNSKILMNHVATKTTDIAMERFKSLRQGENFHALAPDLKTNTYTDVARTQNTIYLRLNYSQPSGTVINVRKSMWIHPVKNRAISIREAARLQTFPDDFVFIGSKDKQYQQVGNAVPPIMAKAIATKLAAQLMSKDDMIMTDNLSMSIRHKNMSHIKSTNTKPEETVRKYLFSCGFRYRKNVKTLPGRPDIVLPKFKAVIFVNGCFWHKHDCPHFVWPTSNIDYWYPKIMRNVERDKKNYKKLEDNGWRVYLVWECQLRKEQIATTFKKLVDFILGIH